MREPVRRNLAPRTLVFKFEDLSTAEAHIYASELRDMLPASVPGATLDHLPATPFPQASDTTVALRIERQSGGFEEGVGNLVSPSSWGSTDH